MLPKLDKSQLRRVNQMEPPIDADVLADTLCDGELVALVLDRWVLADFREISGIIVNTTIKGEPERLSRIPDLIKQMGHLRAEEQFNTFYDFEVINDPACPKKVLEFVLQTLAFLWELQVSRAFPEQRRSFRVGFAPEEGVDGAYYIQMAPGHDSA